MRKPVNVAASLMLPLLLGGCINDSATYYADSSNEHTLTVRRQQEYFWSDDARVTLMASRMPACQRQIPLTELALDDVEVELYAESETRWSLRAGAEVWHVETDTCALSDATGPAVGAKIGVFHSDGERLVFEPATAPK